MTAARDIFVISDLHLGDGGVRDNFEPGGRTQQLHDFIDHVGTEGGELFILGDLFELWQMNTSRIFTYRRPVLDHLVQVPVTYVPGNHDVDLVHFINDNGGLLSHPLFLKMRSPFERQLGTRRFRFFHGHETDPFNNSEAPGFGQMLSIFSGVFEDQNGSPLLATGETMETVLEEFGESMLALWATATAAVSAQVVSPGRDIKPQQALTPAQNQNRLDDHLSTIYAAKEREGWDVAVVGHTHKVGRVGDWYHNSGSWTGSRNWFLRINPEGKVRYFEWKGDRPVEDEEAPTVRGHEFGSTNPIKKAKENLRLLFPRPTPPDKSRIFLMVQGALTVALGVWAGIVSYSQNAGAALTFLISTFGLFGIANGVISLLGSARQHFVKRIMGRTLGVLSILLGLVLLVHHESVLIFSILVGVWALVVGGLRVAAAAFLKGIVEGRWLWIAGLGSMAAGLILLFFPASAEFPLNKVVVGYLCFTGGGDFLAGVFGRRPWKISQSK